MIGVVIPVHNEEENLVACLKSVQLATSHSALNGEDVCVVTVLDACTDGSQRISLNYKVDTLGIETRNVGIARATGADFMVQKGARWLAFTDADSIVSPDWLVAQLTLGVDAVCGTVAIVDWENHHDVELRALLRHRFAATYQDRDQHNHIHGANLGVSAAAYQLAGGFSAVECSEDVALVKALISVGASVSWSAAPRVTTSSRLFSRIRGGFGDALRLLVSP